VAPRPSRDLTRLLLGAVVLSALLIGSFWTLKPFLPALIWSTMIVVSTWPLLMVVQGWVGGHRLIATAVMVVLLLVIVIVPLTIAISTVVTEAEELTRNHAISRIGIPPPPAWVASLPFVGERIAGEWQALASSTPEALASRAKPYVGPVVGWIAAHAGTFGAFVLNLLVTLILCAVLYASGEKAARAVIRFALRLDGQHGETLVRLAGGSIRGVALGVVVTAAVQTFLGALGLVAASVPYVSIFAAVMFVFCIAQIGPTIPLLVAVGWLWYAGDTTAAVLLAIWTVIVASLDNVLRPILIKRGADLPLLLIMGGVIGGLLGFGLMGLFVGPVILAVAYKILGAWVAEGEAASRPASQAGEAAAASTPVAQVARGD